jgi:hypothetical protein
MQLLRASEIPPRALERVYRHSSVQALLWTFVLVVVGCAIAWLLWRDGSAWAYYVAALIVFGLLVMRRFVLARFRPENWLVREREDGLFVQFRSYLNYHFPAEDRTVVFIPYGEIRSVREVRERIQIPTRDAPAQSRRIDERNQRMIELELVADTTMLAKALADELARKPPIKKTWYGSSGTQYKDFPVRLADPKRLQLRWNVVPGAKAFLDALMPRIQVAAPVRAVQDFVHIKGLGRDQQERRLRELAASGETIAAIGIARDLYGFDLTQAKNFVEGLSRGPSDLLH